MRLTYVGHATVLIAMDGTRVITDPVLRMRVAVEAGDEVDIGMLRVTATHAEHDGRRLPLGGATTPALGYRIDGSLSVYFAGDTDLFDGMAAIGRAGIDVALLPVSGWGSRLPPGHLDPLGAARALELLAPKVVVPIHWGTLAPMLPGRSRSMHDEAAHEFARHAAALAPDVDVIVLPPGGSIDL